MIHFGLILKKGWDISLQGIRQRIADYVRCSGMLLPDNKMYIIDMAGLGKLGNMLISYDCQIVVESRMNNKSKANSFLIVNPILQIGNKKRYIYRVDRDSLQLFFWLCSMRIYVNGFIDEDFKQSEVYHKEVYGLDKLEEDQYILIAIRKGEEKFLEKYNVCYKPLVLNPNINRKQIWIYGAGYIGQNAQKYLLDRCIDIQGFIESDIKKVGSRIQEKEIYGKEIIRKLPEDASIIEAGKYYKEIDKMICEAKADVDRYFLKDEFELGIYKENKIIVDAEKSIYWKRASLMNLGEFFPDRKFVFYGDDIDVACKYCEIFEMLDFTNVLIVSNDSDKRVRFPVINYIEEVLYETNYLILLYGKSNSYVDTLLSLGMQEVRDYVHVDQPSILFSINFRKQVLDINLGYTYKTNSEFPGVYVYGMNHENDYRIAVLGGSTSDSMLAPFKSWVQIFYEDYCEKKRGISVFNGAIGGYNSTQELLKLMRDMVHLKPDMIIVYDGYNDARDAGRGVVNSFAFPYMMDIFGVINGRVQNCDSPVNRIDVEKLWTGISFQKNVVGNWLKNIEYMHAVAQINNIKFVAFLQPMLPSKKKLNLHEKSIMRMIEDTYPGVVIAAAKEFRNQGRQMQNDFEYMYDLSGIFDDDDVYMDICHVYENGNRIIAKNIYEIIRGKWNE
jgi:hypothetical protein